MKVFLDTNVFLYSFLNQDTRKKAVAAMLVTEAVRRQNGYVSLQVVKEFCNVMVKKSGKPVSKIFQAIDVFRRMNMINGALDMVRRALEIRERHDIQFYDSLMLSAAEAAGCDTIYTEDLNDGQIYVGVRAINPFKGI